MKASVLPISAIRIGGRADARYFTDADAEAVLKLEIARREGIVFVAVADGIGGVSQPGRLKQTNAVPGEPSLPYLRPSDTYNYIPAAADHLSVSRTRNLDQYRLVRGLILVTRSGRNLGPSVMVDGSLERFALSDDMIRLWIPDERLRFFVFAFLTSDTGLARVRRDDTGSLVNHIGVSHIEALGIPMLSDNDVGLISNLMQLAFERREAARLTIEAARALFDDGLALPESPPARQGWQVSLEALSGRLDVAPTRPRLEEIRRALLDSGGTVASDVCTFLKPPGRYKTRYVGPDEGQPILSGRLVHQHQPRTLKYMAPAALADPKKYVLEEGWTVFQADGRAEEGLALPSVVTPGRAGWLASGHVGRAVPHEGVDPAWLYLAICSPNVQEQMKSLACGSVVDALYPGDLGRIVLPPVNAQVDYAAVSKAWTEFDEAQRLEEQAVAHLEECLDKAAQHVAIA